VRAIKEGKSWLRSLAAQAGNGALTRIPAVTLPHIAQQSPAFWTDVILATAVTHNDAAAIGASLAFAVIFLELLSMNTSPDPQWRVEKYVAIASQIETSSNALRPREVQLKRNGQDLSGNLFETMFPHILMRPFLMPARSGIRAPPTFWRRSYRPAHPRKGYIDEPSEAIVRAVNDTKDNDSIASIVAAAVGARHGIDIFPQEWKSGLLGRTGADDDGPHFCIIDESIQRFVPTGTLHHLI